MTRTTLPAVALAIAAIVAAATPALAMRDPGAGAMPGDGMGLYDYASRIPQPPRAGQSGLNSQYEDGMNLYQYVRSSPPDGLDPAGLWTINRNGGAKATAIAGRDDTIASLAKTVGLNPKEWREWLTHHGPVLGRTIGWSRLGATEKVCGGEVVQVPNTVLAYWAGDAGLLGKFWVRWGQDVATLRTRGFRVAEHQGWTVIRWEKYLKEKTKSKDLHGMFFWGQGVIRRGIIPWWDLTGLATNPKKGWIGLVLGGKRQTLYADWHPTYQLGLGVLWACGTDPTAKRFFSGVFDGFVGVGVPHGFHLFGPTIAKLLPAGSQGTRR